MDHFTGVVVLVGTRSEAVGFVLLLLFLRHTVVVEMYLFHAYFILGLLFFYTIEISELVKGVSLLFFLYVGAFTSINLS